ncbi:hypothetical protein BC332_08434 [Capsicum chinense]|nr:hypothetical protein BC332_08434 [Capsicum chinense]
MSESSPSIGKGSDSLGKIDGKLFTRPLKARIKRKATLSWQSFKRQETLRLVRASRRYKSEPKTDQGSLSAKPIGIGLKNGTCKVDRISVM